MSTLDDIKARVEAATAAPWTPQEYDTNPGDEGVAIIGGGELGSMKGHLVAYAMTLSDEPQCVADGDFIAHARTDVPKLVAALEAVEEKLDNYPLPSRLADPTGAVQSGMEALEGIIRSAIEEALS